MKNVGTINIQRVKLIIGASEDYRNILQVLEMCLCPHYSGAITNKEKFVVRNIIDQGLNKETDQYFFIFEYIDQRNKTIYPCDLLPSSYNWKEGWQVESVYWKDFVEQLFMSHLLRFDNFKYD